MRKIILLEHISLDGFVARTSGALDWIHVGDDVFGLSASLTDACDAAIYGRRTFAMMASYWPTAAEASDASKHDVDHARWVNAADKYVFSKTLTDAPWGEDGSAAVLKGDLAAEIAALKQRPGRDMFLVGSISLARALISLGEVEDIWLTLNPVLLGEGLRLFEGLDRQVDLDLVESRPLAGGVVALHYTKAA